MSDSRPSIASAALARPGLRVVLLGPKRGANVGAACRAIKNMGAGSLVVVGGDFDPDEARRTAVHADDVFDGRVEAASFEEAVADAALVIGTTSRQKPWSIPVVAVDEVFAEARRRGLGGEQVALVFGPEDRGLANDELSLCHRLTFIPTADEYSSLNLAQAVVVCLYEWLRSSRHPEAAGPAEAPRAAAGDKAQRDAIADLRDVLAEIGFLDGDQGERVMATIASMLMRSGLDDREVRILRGIARQVRWAARRGAARGTTDDDA